MTKKILSFCLALHCFLPLAADTPDTDTGLFDRTIEYAKGHAAFKSIYFKQHEKEFVRLAREGQTPQALFIGCSDSRVMPDFLLNSRPGQVFVVRNAGNFVPTFDEAINWDGIAASINYAVDVLGVTDVIVCGHSHCGAVQALFTTKDGKDSSPAMQSITKWLRFGQRAKEITQLSLPKDATNEQRYAVAEKLSVIFQLEHLLSYPSIKQKVDAQKVYLHGWFINIETGELTFYDPTEAKFVSMQSIVP